MTEENPRPRREVRAGLKRFYYFFCFTWAVFVYGRFAKTALAVEFTDWLLILGVPLSVPAFLYFGLGVVRRFTGRVWPDWW